MSTINTNIKALYVQSALQTNERSLTAAMQQLSSGKRINSAKDDAAGLAISTRMTQQIESLNQAVRNANDAISLVQTAEGAMQEITTMLQRMRELAIQAMNDTNANDQRSYLDLEFQQLKQQIVQIANNTEWNGFPILNGSAGYRVGPVPVFKTVADGQSSSTITYTAGAVTSSSNSGLVAVAGTGTLSKSGALSVTINAGGTTAAATLRLDDGATVSLSGTVSNKTITFTNSALTDGAGTFTMTASGTGSANWAATDTASLTITRSLPTLATMSAGDVIINGQTVPAATADAISTSDNAAASAIARAAAINSVTANSGVQAVVGKTVVSGAAMTPAASVTGSITLNGYVSPTITTVANNTQASRAAVVAAINTMTRQTGVIAIDTGSDASGVRLEAADGRNVELAFNSGATAAAFAAGTGLRQGVQSGIVSLESPVDVPVAITSNGDIDTSGLSIGDFTANQTAVSTLPRAIAASASDVAVLKAGDLVINGVAVPPSVAGSDNVSVSDGTVTSSVRAASAIAIAAAINSVSAQTGVTAKANAVSINAAAVDTYNFGTQTLYINGHAISVNLSTDPTTRVANIVDAINHQLGDGGVVAKASGGGVMLTSTDGRNLSVWYNSSQNDGATPTAHTLSAASFGLDGAAVTGISGATITSAGAKTVYATVSLQSTVPDAPQPAYANVVGTQLNPDGLITVEAGQNGFGSNSNFSALGFAEGTYGGKSGVDMSPPRVGRLTFQVGASAGQVVTIDLADFGEKGPITGAITKDYQSGTPTVQIGNAEGANAVLSLLDAAMNKVNATRASMGAVMNRLTHVVDNLTNVSTNSAQSRSQIEDADYAAASTDLARAQIIQQAATAVLAQANASQQSVLKLLQG